ncbi:carboxymuconolactone decarboxylase family protein [Tomitella cavernea]|uniref:Carboxymuconolactone decarboxylase family protein n=1 Tax=Tomitella cavernea TaxID=1387982 RepID=A0ABP9CPN1_9ACTN|nr:carboxymuconolactone decarboxylase family protein [Tomitella cavernea]
MSSEWEWTARGVLVDVAPEAAAVLDRLACGVVPGMAALTALARVTCAGALGLEPLASVSAPAVEPAAVVFAEQFSLDVSAVTAAQHADLEAVLGGRAGEFALAVYAADWVPRVRRTLAELFGGAGEWPADVEEVDGLWPAVGEYVGAVARLPLLEPVLTELVRLRGARQHECRMCKSLRSTPAMAAGADEDLFDAIDDYEDAGFTPRQRAALALTDAMIWRPAYLPGELPGTVREHFTPAEAVELVLDISRNAVNKVAVSQDRDQARIPGGLQSYEVHADGTIEYGEPIRLG